MNRILCLALAALVAGCSADDQRGGSEIKPRQTLKGYANLVSAIAFSPDGKVLASASPGEAVRLCDLATGRDITTLKSDGVSLAFSPDGKILASGEDEGGIRLCDVATGKEVLRLEGHTNHVHSVAFSPDGKTLASASADETAKLWDVSTGRNTATFGSDVGLVGSVAFSPDGKTLVSASVSVEHSQGKAGGKTEIKFWDVTTGGCVSTLDEGGGIMRLSPDGAILAWDAGRNTVKLWDVAAKKTIRVLTGHADSVGCLAFSPDGKTLASGSFDKTVKLWNVATGENTVTLPGHVFSVHSVAFAPDGKTLASADGDTNGGQIYLWDVTAEP